jgi:uncharacterized tellurite resistance protein B-like protein
VRRAAAPSVLSVPGPLRGFGLRRALGRGLRYWLAAPEASPLDPCDVPVALGALLLRAAASDYRDVLGEAALIDAVLARRHDLTAAEAAEMRATCEAVAVWAPETAIFAALLCEAVAYRDRLALALCLCDVLAADPAALVLAEAVLGVPQGALTRDLREG